MFSKKEMILLTELGEPRNSGEFELKRYFRWNDWIVEDLSDNSHYWGKDIDLYVYKRYQPDTAFTIEVKWDGCIAHTGNLFLETSSDLWCDKQGWFEFCQADYIYYGDRVNKVFYKINREKLLEWFNANKDSLKYRTANDYYQGRLVKQSGGYLVPLKMIEELIEEKIDLGEIYDVFKDI